ncbi:DUF5050 domain-containing protein [Clostridium folliculivorans]|uniref:Prolow-density lipoprotein receptor-related protein 1-like beta-propeller domain-containing protein n=1 Tax=Clostridium folliculivorans TaxID=2886038 RepID=A0A9W5Y3V7_9CLOT|nr:DUF5050 domain-containing protein [Clostridium folliculivorans]GKU26060.1 hypothetical protein CFOLD11_28870 [Clostridium folliculivorans]GKU28146.1 hypothetical protein CFB3_02520 [Clostridium folliculivorans]
MKKRFFISAAIILIISVITFFSISYKKAANKDKPNEQVAKNKTQETKSTSSNTSVPATAVESLNSNLKLTDNGLHNSVDNVNSLSNYLNGGFVRYSNPFLFISPSVTLSYDSPLVYSMEDGTTLFKQLSIISNASSINIINNTVYYKSNSISTLMKSNISTHENTILASQCGPYYIYNDWIYFISPSDCSIKKMTLNGDLLTTIKTDLSKDKNWYPEDPSTLFIYNNKIYYSDMVTYGDEHNLKWKNEIYSMNLDGTNLEKVLEDSFFSFALYENSIYYFRTLDDTSVNRDLVRFDLSTKKGSTLSSFSNAAAEGFNIYNNDLYFLDIHPQNNSVSTGFDTKLQKYNLTTKKTSTISNSITAYGKIFILNDRIFVLPIGVTDKNSYLYYSVKTDGSEQKYVK